MSKTARKRPDPVHPLVAYRQSVHALVGMVEADPTLLAEAVDCWMQGGEAATGEAANVTILAVSPSAGSFADTVIDVDAPPDAAPPADRWTPADWNAATPVAAWWAVYSDSLLLCATRSPPRRGAA